MLQLTQGSNYPMIFDEVLLDDLDDELDTSMMLKSLYTIPSRGGIDEVKEIQSLWKNSSYL